MKKALIIASVASMIEQFNMNNIKLLQELGYQVDVATNFENSGTITQKRSNELKQELKEINVNCFQIDFNRSILSSNNIKAYRQVKKIINENNYNLIHMHSPIGGVCGRLAAKKARKRRTRVIYTAHGFHFFKGAPILNWIIFYPIEKHLSRYTDCLITINQEDYELAKRKFKAKQIELVHGVGVDESKFNFEMTPQEKHELRESLGLKDDDFVIIYVAELSKRKNQGMLIKAVKELIDEGKTNIKVLLPGIDSMNGYYQKMSKDLGIEENIKFLGYRKDIPKLLKISDLYVSTAKQEGLPVNIMEAMFCELPIVATDCRGNRDLVEDCVNVNDVNKVKNKIYDCLEEKSQNKVNKVNCYKLVSIINEMKKIYNGDINKL